MINRESESTMSATEISVRFLGCSHDPLEVAYSAYLNKNFAGSAVDNWERIRSGTISRSAMVDTLGLSNDCNRVISGREQRPAALFIFVVENISRAGIEQIRRRGLQPGQPEHPEQAEKKAAAGFSFLTPVSYRRNPDVEQAWQELQKKMSDFQQLCRKRGIPETDRTMALPHATAEREQLSMDFQSMQLFLDHALCEKSPYETGLVAGLIYKIMKSEFPSLAAKLGAKCWENRMLYCDEKPQFYKLCKWSTSRPHKQELLNIWKGGRNPDMEVSV